MGLLEKFRQLSERSVFVRNIVNIASANIFSQAILLLTIPILTRLFTPAQFGVAALFLSALQLCVAFCTWSFDRLVPNAKSKLSAQILCLYAFFCVITVSTLIFLIIFYDLPLLQHWKGTRELGALLILLPLTIIALGFTKIGNSWFARETDLSAVSKSIIAYTIGYLVIAIAGGIAGFNQSALVLAIAGSYWFQCLTILYFVKAPIKWKSVTRKRALAIGKKNLSPATTQSTVVFVNTLSLAAPVFLLAQVYSVAELGGYALVLRLVVTPLGVLTKSLSVSFWSRAAELVRENQYQKLQAFYKKVCLLMTVPALFAITFCAVGSKIIPLILGDEWEEASKVLLVIIPYVIGFAIVSPTNHLWVLNKQIYQLIADGSRLVLMLVCIAAAHYFEWPFIWAVFALSVSSLIGHALLFGTHIVVYKRHLHA